MSDTQTDPIPPDVLPPCKATSNVMCNGRLREWGSVHRDILPTAEAIDLVAGGYLLVQGPDGRFDEENQPVTRTGCCGG